MSDEEFDAAMNQWKQTLDELAKVIKEMVEARPCPWCQRP